MREKMRRGEGYSSIAAIHSPRIAALATQFSTFSFTYTGNSTRKKQKKER